MRLHKTDAASTNLWSRSSFRELALALSFLSAFWVLWVRELGKAPSLLQSPATQGYPDYYRAQAEAMLDGHLWVPISALGDECYFIDGRCFGYFGVSPSLLRLVPAMLDVPGDLSPISSLLGYLSGVAGALLLLQAVWRWLGPARDSKNSWFEALVFLVVALAIGPGSVLVFAARTDVADEAILWGSSAMIWTTLCVILWFQKQSFPLLWAGVFFAVIAGGARPSVLPAVVGLGAIGCVVAYRASPRKLGAVGGFVVLSVFPLLATSSVFLVKFGKPIPDLRENYLIASSIFWRNLRSANNDVLFSWIYMPQNAWNFLRPTALDYDFFYPRGLFFRPTDTFWPAPSGGSYLEPAGSLTAFSPLLVFLCIIALLPIFVTRLRPVAHYGLLLGVAGALSLSVIATWSQVAMTNRYLVDAAPLLVYLGILGGAVLALHPPNWRWLRALTSSVLVMLTLVGVVTTVYVMR